MEEFGNFGNFHTVWLMEFNHLIIMSKEKLNELSFLKLVVIGRVGVKERGLCEASMLLLGQS